MKLNRIFALSTTLFLLSQTTALADLSTIYSTAPLGHKGSVTSLIWGTTAIPATTDSSVESSCANAADIVHGALDGDAEADERSQKYLKVRLGDALRAGTQLYLIKQETVRCDPDPRDTLGHTFTVRTYIEARVTDPKSSQNGTTVWLLSERVSGL